MVAAADMLIHATCVRIGGVGVLIRGPSGAGKSDLAMRLLDRSDDGQQDASRLVSDDQVRLTLADGRVRAHTALNLADKLEIRGFGIVTCPTVTDVPIGLVVDAAPFDQIERMPEADELVVELLGVSVPRVLLELTAPSAVAKLRFVLNVTQNSPAGD